MSLVGNFYSRVTAEKLEILLRSSPKPTMIELQAAITDGEKVLGSEVLVQLGGLRKRIQEHMQDLNVGDAIQEVAEVLALVSSGHHPSAILWSTHRNSSVYRQTRATLRRNLGFRLPAIHTVLNSMRYQSRRFGFVVFSSNPLFRKSPSSFWKLSELNLRNERWIMLSQERVPPGTSNGALSYSSIRDLESSGLLHLLSQSDLFATIDCDVPQYLTREQ